MASNDPESSSSVDNSRFQVLGICGGIGSGKSTACKLLVSENNCLEHLDADSMAHSVYSPGSQAVKDIVAEFGSEILLDEEETSNREIDRKKLGAIVFADRSSMSKLEQIVWPHVKDLIVNKINALQQEWEEQKTSAAATPKRPIVILEAAVLLDANWDDLLDGIWVVTVPRDVARQRLIETRGLSQEEAEKRLTAQEMRRGIGNLQQELEGGVVTGIIENNGGLDELAMSLTKALDDPSFWKEQKQ